MCGQRDSFVLAGALSGRRDAYLRGIERRIAAGLNPRVVLSLRFSSAAGTPRSWARFRELTNKLGIAIAAELTKPTWV